MLFNKSLWFSKLTLTSSWTKYCWCKTKEGKNRKRWNDLERNQGLRKRHSARERERDNEREIERKKGKKRGDTEKIQEIRLEREIEISK